jgi:hypothetical protein
MMLRYAASLILLFGSSTAEAYYNTGIMLDSTEIGVLRSDLDQYRGEYVINLQVKANFEESASYILSKSQGSSV